MKIVDLPYNHNMLDPFGPNDVYRKCHKELVSDFERVYESFMQVDVTNFDETARANVVDQKTHMLVSFVSGHLNAFNPQSAFFEKFNSLMGNSKEPEKEKSPLSSLILPDHLR